MEHIEFETRGRYGAQDHPRIPEDVHRTFTGFLLSVGLGASLWVIAIVATVVALWQ